LEEALPRNIQWLNLTDDHCCQQEWEWEYETPYSLGALQSWLPVWKKSTPRLQGLCLLMKVMKAQDWPVMIQGLKEIGAQSGI
jgi:hypothetical protein